MEDGDICNCPTFLDDIYLRSSATGYEGYNCQIPQLDLYGPRFPDDWSISCTQYFDKYTCLTARYLSNLTLAYDHYCIGTYDLVKQGETPTKTYTPYPEPTSAGVSSCADFNGTYHAVDYDCFDENGNQMEQEENSCLRYCTQTFSIIGGNEDGVLTGGGLPVQVNGFPNGTVCDCPKYLNDTYLRSFGFAGRTCSSVDLYGSNFPDDYAMSCMANATGAYNCFVARYASNFTYSSYCFGTFDRVAPGATPTKTYELMPEPTRTAVETSCVDFNGTFWAIDYHCYRNETRLFNEDSSCTRYCTQKFTVSGSELTTTGSTAMLVIDDFVNGTFYTASNSTSTDNDLYTCFSAKYTNNAFDHHCVGTFRRLPLAPVGTGEAAPTVIPIDHTPIPEPTTPLTPDSNDELEICPEFNGTFYSIDYRCYDNKDQLISNDANLCTKYCTQRLTLSGGNAILQPDGSVKIAALIADGFVNSTVCDCPEQLTDAYLRDIGFLGRWCTRVDTYGQNFPNDYTMSCQFESGAYTCFGARYKSDFTYDFYCRGRFEKAVANKTYALLPEPTVSSSNKITAADIP
ncbi:hypothetical protein HK102_002035 [Quaeritorhiza haematococci]|nr:hypothetical protein HK102_002035 [Quaeritorhiza haematococci]